MNQSENKVPSEIEHNNNKNQNNINKTINTLLKI